MIQEASPVDPLLLVPDHPSTSCAPTPPPPQPPPPPPPPPFKKPPAPLSSKLTPFQDKLLKTLENADEHNYDKTFLLSVLPRMKQLSEIDKLQFQMHILQFFVNLNQSVAQSQFYHPPPYRSSPYSNQNINSPPQSTHHSDESMLGDFKEFNE